MKIIFLFIGFIALIFVGISQYDKIKKKTLKNETTSFLAINNIISIIKVSQIGLVQF